MISFLHQLPHVADCCFQRGNLIRLVGDICALRWGKTNGLTSRMALRSSTHLLMFRTLFFSASLWFCFRCSSFFGSYSLHQWNTIGTSTSSQNRIHYNHLHDWCRLLQQVENGLIRESNTYTARIHLFLYSIRIRVWRLWDVGYCHTGNRKHLHRNRCYSCSVRVCQKIHVLTR